MSPKKCWRDNASSISKPTIKDRQQRLTHHTSEYQFMTAPLEKETGQTYRPSSRTGKESIRSGESEYGRQLSGGLFVGPIQINPAYEQMFLGSEIALLEPLSLRSITSLEKHDWVSPAGEEISTAQIAGKIHEFKYTNDGGKISKPEIPLSNEYIFKYEKANINNDYFTARNYDGSDIFSGVGLSEAGDLSIGVGQRFDIVDIVRIPFSSATASDTIRREKQPFPQASSNLDQPKSPTPDSLANSSSVVRTFQFDHSRKKGFAVIKSADDEIGDTLSSDSSSRLDARYFSQVEFVIYSGKANATLIGNSSDNTLIGSIGNDRLIGQGGDDQLVGGAGNDVFVFGTNDGHDHIVDLSHGDKLQFLGATSLNQIELKSSEAGQQIQFGHTIVEIVGASELVISSDWIILAR